ncbi:pol polyprotein [Pseudoloma neurophilia]|uniref:Pol polyprotein n=1 Tax=Pseudoloma neurophilia TaxID=146866 RepID=A0A0R0LX89_9MICR|nr:pol polyprotein [Pseudoloma neurophilia]
MGEAEYLCFETKILEVERELTFCDGFRKSSKDLKLKKMEILNEKKSHQKMFAEIIEYLTIEYERIRRKNIDKEKKELEARLEELQREYRYTRMIWSDLGPARRKRACYNCGNVGHIAIFCRSDEGEGNCGYQKDLWQEKFKKKKYTEGQKGMFDLDDFIKSFPDVFMNLDRIVEFCPIDKCPIETETGVVIVKRGSVVPQAKEGKEEEYLKVLLDRKVMRKSTSQWRNPIRFIEQPNGGLRLVSNEMALDDAVKKDSYTIPTMREIYTTTQGCKWFTVIDLEEAYYYIENVESDKCKTAFEFKGQVYEWNGMVMGFKNSPMVMQRTMDRIFKGMI